jgi:hypothetical protein
LIRLLQSEGYPGMMASPPVKVAQARPTTGALGNLRTDPGCIV